MDEPAARPEAHEAALPAGAAQPIESPPGIAEPEAQHRRLASLGAASDPNGLTDKDCRLEKTRSMRPHAQPQLVGKLARPSARTCGR